LISQLGPNGHHHFFFGFGGGADGGGGFNSSVVNIRSERGKTFSPPRTVTVPLKSLISSGFDE
jgi:hypothetical protein